MKYSVIVVAAGKGTRTKLSYNKVFYNIGDGSIISNTLVPFDSDPDCERIVMAISPNEEEEFRKIIHSEKVVYVEGGATRQESGYLALKKVETEYVMIHDGVRPFVSKQNLDDLKDALKDHDAALLMIPVIDTIKEVKDGYVVHTPNRSDYYSAQTPQAFKTSLIKECHEKGRNSTVIASDDAMLVELHSDVPIKVVEGSYDNIKVTTQRDLKQVHLIQGNSNLTDD